MADIKNEVATEGTITGRIAVTTTPKPVLHAFMDESSGEIFLSAYAPDHPMWEANHIVLVELRLGQINKHSSVMNILSNVLQDAGITLDTKS